MTGGIFGRHGDILNVVPNEGPQKDHLMTELKARGNHAFKARSFEEAEVLYTRLLELAPEEHTIYGNRSAARCSMGKLDLALEDAEVCIAKKRNWAKGFFRKGQALMHLKRHGEAYQAFKKAVQLEPTNKSAAEHMKKAETAAKEQGQNLQGEPKAIEKRKTASKEGSGKTNVKKSTTTPSKATSVVNSEDLGSVVRGYKKTSDGRTTTFFNNELTDEARELIGDIAPKRIDDAAAVQIQNVKGASAWNAGTTFEERVMTSWATDRLKALFKSVEYRESNGPEGETVVSVTKLDNLEGDASIAVMRGKKRHLFDFAFKLKCKGEFGDAPDDQAEGVLTFTDVSSDCNDEYDAEIGVQSRYSTTGGKKLYQMLSDESSSFRQLILSKLKTFREELEEL